MCLSKCLTLLCVLLCFFVCLYFVSLYIVSLLLCILCIFTILRQEWTNWSASVCSFWAGTEATSSTDYMLGCCLWISFWFPEAYEKCVGIKWESTVEKKIPFLYLVSNLKGLWHWEYLIFVSANSCFFGVEMRLLYGDWISVNVILAKKSWCLKRLVHLLDLKYKNKQKNHHHQEVACYFQMVALKVAINHMCGGKKVKGLSLHKNFKLILVNRWHSFCHWHLNLSDLGLSLYHSTKQMRDKNNWIRVIELKSMLTSKL